jgi:hypothetical protein
MDTTALAVIKQAPEPIPTTVSKPAKIQESVDVAQIARLARESLALLMHPYPPNVENVRQKIAKIVHLADPHSELKRARLDKSQPRQAQLDKGTGIGASPASDDADENQDCLRGPTKH